MEIAIKYNMIQKIIWMDQIENKRVKEWEKERKEEEMLKW